MKTPILSAFLLLAGCATTYSAGGHVTDACEIVKVSDPRLAGYTVYSCPRPFAGGPVYGGRGCADATREASNAKGPLRPCGWSMGFTDKANKEVFAWDVYLPEILEHEALHASGQIRDDE